MSLHTHLSCTLTRDVRLRCGVCEERCTADITTVAMFIRLSHDSLNNPPPDKLHRLLCGASGRLTILHATAWLTTRTSLSHCSRYVPSRCTSTMLCLVRPMAQTPKCGIIYIYDARHLPQTPTNVRTSSPICRVRVYTTHYHTRVVCTLRNHLHHLSGARIRSRAERQQRLLGYTWYSFFAPPPRITWSWCNSGTQGPSGRPACHNDGLVNCTGCRAAEDALRASQRLLKASTSAYL